MKKLLSVLLSMFIAFSLAATIHAQGELLVPKPVNNVYFNEASKNADDVNIIEVGGDVLLPLRGVFEAIGYTVTWDNDTQVMTALKLTDIVQFQAKSNTIIINGGTFELEHGPVKVNSRLYIDRNTLIQILNADISWNKDTNSLNIIQSIGNGFLWKIEDEDNIVYLLGSIHAGNASLYPIRDEIEQAFFESDYAVFEVDLTKQLTEEDTQKINALQAYKDNKTLKDALSPATYEKLQKVLELKNLPKDQFDKLQPWVVNLNLSSLIETEEVYYTNLGIDFHFMGRAIQQQKPILELESILLQYEMFASYSDDYIEQSINRTLNTILGITDPNIPPLKDYDYIPYLGKMWKKGDVETLAAILEDIKQDKETYTNLLVNRHDNMIEQIEGYFDSEDKATYFVTVGSLHTLGEVGLVKLLQDKGYKVTQY